MHFVLNFFIVIYIFRWSSGQLMFASSSGTNPAQTRHGLSCFFQANFSDFSLVQSFFYRLNAPLSWNQECQSTLDIVGM